MTQSLEIQNLKKDVKIRGELIIHYRQQIASMGETINQLMKDNAFLQMKSDDSKELALKRAKEELFIYQDQCQKLTTENINLRAKLEKTEKTLEATERGRNGALQRNNELYNRTVEQTNESGKARDRIKILENALKGTRARLDAECNRFYKMGKTLAEVESKLRNQTKEHEKEVAELKRKYTVLNARNVYLECGGTTQKFSVKAIHDLLLSDTEETEINELVEKMAKEVDVHNMSPAYLEELVLTTFKLMIIKTRKLSREITYLRNRTKAL